MSIMPVSSRLGAAGNNLVYEAPPTIANFMLDPRFIRFLLGPVGSGKTTGVMFEVFRRCCEQAPGPDGLRRTRWAIVRNTLSQMRQTVLQDVVNWLGPVANYKVSDNVIQIRVRDIYSDWYLIPLDDPENQNRLLSLQLTGAWLNEFIELDPDLVPPIAGRLNRYPSAAQGGATWAGMVGDSNMPNAGSRWHEHLDLKVPEDWGVHFQPGGLSPGAENLNYLAQSSRTLALPMNHPERIEAGLEYYRRLQRQHAGNWVKRYVHAQFGDDPDGTAVFRESFNRDFHVAKEALIPSTGLPLTIGQDFGRNPCALICQMNHRGQLMVLQEVVSENMGLELHIASRLRPYLVNDERFMNKRTIVVGDPAGMAGNELTEANCFTTLEREGFHAFPAPTNLVEPRLAAVEAMLSTATGGRPGLIICPKGCPQLVQALHSKYLFARRKDGEARPKPDKKHPWSDLADALQYVCLAMTGEMKIAIRDEMTRRSSVNMAPRRRVNHAAWT